MESTSRTLVCSVVFLDIAEYSMKPVTEQLQLKQAFNRILASALEQVAPRDRVVLDTGDGAAVTFLGDPEDALFVAMSIRDAALTLPAISLPTRIGLNLGPVRLVRDINGQINIIGDGINVAQRVMSFSNPGQLLVSRSFYEVVSCLSRDYAGLFTFEGARTDKHVREHEVYSVGTGQVAGRRVAAIAARSQIGRLVAWLAVPGPFGLHRAALVAAPLVFGSIAGSGVALRAAAQAPVVPQVVLREQAPSAATKPQMAAAASPAPAPVARPRPSAGQKKESPTTVQLARVQIAVAPWGEVFVNGQSRGVSPPLKSLDVPPGEHTIEIKNGPFPSRVERLELKPGQQVRIRHRFH